MPGVLQLPGEAFPLAEGILHWVCVSVFGFYRPG
jgi:hypothetical protein